MTLCALLKWKYFSRFSINDIFHSQALLKLKLSWKRIMKNENEKSILLSNKAPKYKDLIKIKIGIGNN